MQQEIYQVYEHILNDRLICYNIEMIDHAISPFYTRRRVSTCELRDKSFASNASGDHISDHSLRVKGGLA